MTDNEFSKKYDGTPVEKAFIVFDIAKEYLLKINFISSSKDFWELATTLLLHETKESLGEDFIKDHNHTVFNTQDAEHNKLLKKIDAAVIACAYATDAMRTHKENRTQSAWNYICSALYWAGITQEKMDTLSDYKRIVSNSARKAALAGHKENHEMRASVIKWYMDTRNEHNSMSKAANAAFKANLVPVAHRTLYEWIREFEKKLRSAREQ